MRIDGKSTYGGTFISEEDAALRYNELALSKHGSHAKMNIVERHLKGTG